MSITIPRGEVWQADLNIIYTNITFRQDGSIVVEWDDITEDTTCP